VNDWRALAQPDLAVDGVAISLKQRLPDGTSLAIQPTILTVAIIDEGVHAPVALRLQDDAARALYEALAAYFGDIPDSITQRARVDVLIERVEQLLDERAVPQVVEIGVER